MVALCTTCNTDIHTASALTETTLLSVITNEGQKQKQEEQTNNMKDERDYDNEYGPPRHMNRGRLRKMLAALSFERTDIVMKGRRGTSPRRKNRSGVKRFLKSSRTWQVGNKSSPIILNGVPNGMSPSSSKETDHSSSSDCLQDHSNNSLSTSGTSSSSSSILISSSSCEVFFDAAQSERDLLLPGRRSREQLSFEDHEENVPPMISSVVVVQRGGYETVLKLLNHNCSLPNTYSGSATIPDSAKNTTSDCEDRYGCENFTGILTSRMEGENEGGKMMWLKSKRDDIAIVGSSASIDPPVLPIVFPSPAAPLKLPIRFLRAGKNDPTEGRRRYDATLQWRATEKIDTILHEANRHFNTIKQYYPHYCHFKGKNGEPCFYEKPGQTNLKKLREAGITLPMLLRHYIAVTEYQWQYLIRDDFMTSIYIVDLDGMKLSDFAGEAVDFVKKASTLSSQHYPERAGCVFVINVPIWFKVIWNVVKPMVDEATLKKVYILRGKDEIKQKMMELIDVTNIPPEYGGSSVPLGQSHEEQELAAFMTHNNSLEGDGEDAAGKEDRLSSSSPSSPPQRICPCHPNDWRQCRFCTWVPARAY